MKMRLPRNLALLLCLLTACCATPRAQAAQLTELDETILAYAKRCRDDVTGKMQGLIASGQLKKVQLFDTFYIPIANTDPQKYTTQYDKYLDDTIRDILDACLAKDEQMIFVVAVDRNGYLPTHNTKYSQPLTGNAGVDVSRNRTKRIFNDRTGLAAAKNTEPYLLQRYSRDTGEQMVDLSVPIYIEGDHWGALRIGYKAK